MKFILSKELGRLAKWLRILGYDAQYFNGRNLSSLVVDALRDDRVILTRNQRLANKDGLKIAHIESEMPKKQIAQVLKEFHIHPDDKSMFSRCVICNEELVSVQRSKVKEKVPEYVYATNDNFIVCPRCARVYWKGTHWGNVQKILKEIL